MPRKLLSLAFVLAVVAVACAEPTRVEVEFGSGARFVPFVTDSLNDTGVDPSVVVNEEGLPIVAYFGFPEETVGDVPPATRPVGAPSIPAVLLATSSPEGVWTRGALAIEKAIPNVSIAFNPAFEPTVVDLSHDSVTGLQLAIDGDGGLHAVWGSADGLFYAEGSSDPNAAEQVTVQQVTDTRPFGPSLALDGSTPWISYSTSASSSSSVQVATPDGDDWRIDPVAPAAGCDTCRTAVAATDAGPAVAYTDGGRAVWVATNDGENGWVSFEVGPGGQGLAAAATGDGIALTYYDGSQVVVAMGAPAGPFETAPVADVDDASATGDGAGTSVAIAGDGLAVAWRDAAEGIGAATGADGALEPIETRGETAEGASPSVAASADGSTVYVTWYDTLAQDLLVGAYGEIDELAIAAPSPTPGVPVQPSTAPPSGCTPAEGGAVTVVAEGVSFVEGSCIEVPAAEPFTIEFDNRDDAAAVGQHNIQIFPSADDLANPLFEGELVSGPAVVQYQVDPLDPGTYFFNCAVHPTMTGSVEAVDGGGGGTGGDGGTGATGPGGETGADGGGGGGGVTTTVTAEGIAFDTSTIELPAGEKTTITLVNNDAGTPHNIAIYEDDTQAVELFDGDPLTGPGEIEYTIPPLEAGEYYFVCIFHSNMSGSVIVS